MELPVDRQPVCGRADRHWPTQRQLADAGFKLSRKETGVTAIREPYMLLIHAIGVCLVGAEFAAPPVILTVVLLPKPIQSL